MGKTGKWLKHLLTGGGKKVKKKAAENHEDKDKDEEKTKIRGMSSPLPMLTETRSAPPSVSTPKEKRRWSFRRSVGTGKELNSPDPPASAPPTVRGVPDPDMNHKRHAMAVAVATAAAADAAVVAAQAAAAVVRLTTSNATRVTAGEAAAATRIQACFRSYLARKALHALKGLVKLQALVRGHLVRKQATATLRCMQALITVQARARAQRIQMLEEPPVGSNRPVSRRSPQHQRYQQAYEIERNMEDNVKIVEMDLGESRGSSKSRSSYSVTPSERTEQRYSAYGGSRAYSKPDPYQQVSPVPSALTDTSPRGCSGHFEDFAFATAQSSPHYFSPNSIPDPRKSSYIVSHQDGTYSVSSDYPFFPSYMANTESSKAKARSQSAPKQRPESCERQPSSSRRRPSVEGRNIPRSGRMQRSISHVGASVGGYRYPWPIKLDKSNVSLKDSECGSSSTVQTSTYCRSLVF